jgi:hypothetical protein
MPTLKEFEEKGVDVTLMSTEQLITEGYVTPTNELPSIITSIGDYRTRAGCRVSIRELHPTVTLATTAFHAKGSFWKTTQKLGSNPKYGIWHVSGRAKVQGLSSADIVEKWHTYCIGG